MIQSRRDYLLRIIDEVTRLLAQVVFKRRGGADQEALQSVVVGFERLFNLDGHQLFQLTPEHHYHMLTQGEAPFDARDKVLLYAALSAEAGTLYERLGNRPMARATRLNALRFALRARLELPAEGTPPYAPDIAALREALADEPLDPDTAELIERASRVSPGSLSS